MLEYTVECDGCGKSVKDSNVPLDGFRLALSSQPRNFTGHSVLATEVRDPLPDAKHFCNMDCLKKWVSNE